MQEVGVMWMSVWRGIMSWRDEWISLVDHYQNIMGTIKLTFSLSYNLIILRKHKIFLPAHSIYLVFSAWGKKLLNWTISALKHILNFTFIRSQFLLTISKGHLKIFSKNLYNNYNFNVIKSDIKFPKVGKSLDHENNHKFRKCDLP